MPALEILVPTPALVEIDRVDLAAPAPRVWEVIRHADLARSPLTRALFALRTLPSRLTGAPAEETSVRLDDLTSTPEHPGFQILADAPPHEVVVGAIGKVWHLDIPFVHVTDAARFAAFAEPGFIKVAWALRVSPHGEEASHLELEVRVSATDEESWRKFRRYFRVIGPGSHFIRRSLLRALEKELGAVPAQEEDRALPGDEGLPDARAQLTDVIDVAATPEAIWPWLVQMGCDRAGFYSVDVLDNDARESAREVHPELQDLRVGDVIPARSAARARAREEGAEEAGGADGFEVLRVDAPRALVLGGLYDPDAGGQLPFASPRPRRYWHVTWAFALEPLDERSTRLHVRARAAFPPGERLHAAWIRPVHRFMQSAQLRHLAARVEGRLREDGWREVTRGVGGAALMTVALLTPFLRGRRSEWGLSPGDASRPHPGDELVPRPRWMWTHGIEIEAPAAEVWPWVAQIGATRAGFYSYQWLENVVGCGVHNAERVHPEWEVRAGDEVVLHPDFPPQRVVALRRGHYFVTHAPPAEGARESGKPWVAGSWLFLVEPLGDRRCRFVSRYRADCSDDVVTRLSFGPTLVEPVGFVMDRRMLLGVKERSERARPARAVPKGAQPAR